ncbi:hypothetical protein [Phycicoccus avicenniae]|uniref:hypothetical protein n=1 Tax=Phycicoccus avicenniae TaxID=2828860 RepID=UPI003D2E8F95
MALAPARVDRQAERDAGLGLAVAGLSASAFVVLVALPLHVDAATFVGAGPLGFVLGAVLAPVAAGLAACSSGAALSSSWSDLTRRARCLHVTTIAVGAVLAAGYVASSGALRTWLD